MPKYRVLIWKDFDFDPREKWDKRDIYYPLELLRTSTNIDIQELPLPSDTTR